ncbi:hypothetical protein ACS0TY_034006 [Phlomoides rotata]
MATLSTELRHIFDDDFDEHSLSEDDSPSTVLKLVQMKHKVHRIILFVSYKEHARLKGFSVVKRTSKRAVEGDEYKYAKMVCDKSGSSRANKTSKRVGCTARLNAIRHDNGSWIISKMVTEHNHEIDPTFSPLMPAHRKLNVHKKRRLRLGDGDADAIRQLFCRLQLKDGNFFYSMDLEQDGRLHNVLWIRPRCRAGYEEFHDVVSFDTTYLVNRVYSILI